MKTGMLVLIALLVWVAQTNAAAVRPSPNSIAAGPKADSEHPDRKANVVAEQKQSNASAAKEEAPKAVELDDLKPAESIRHNKMLDYFGGYMPHPFAYPFMQPFYQPQPQYYADDSSLDDEAMSRGNRRKPSSNQNSPIYYIRLPPTPYMYVPGMGYISQPPTIRPMAIAPPMPPPNPFINVPVNFLSNGKPTNVYEWPSAPSMNFGPQYPSYLPNRPMVHQRPPSYRPHKPSYLPDSKITHLKGPYVFNGRPEDIYVLPNSGPPSQSPFGMGMGYNPAYGGHNYNGQYNHEAAYNNPQQSHYTGYTPYNSGYNSIFSEALGNYY